MAEERQLAEMTFMTVAEVAAVMRVSKMTVYRLVHSGELPAVLARAALAVLVASQLAVVLRERTARTFGGVGGDVLGAGVEVALTASLVVMTVAS